MTVIVQRGNRAIGLILLSSGLLLVACSSPGTQATASSGSATEPTIAVIPSEPVSESASPSVSPEQTASEPALQMAEPPAASIAVEGGDPVVGQLGTFTWDNGGSDAPWLDGSPIHVGVGEVMTLTLATPEEISDWTVSRVLPGNRDGTGAIGMAEGSGEPVVFDAPPAGTWSVLVHVAFAQNSGTALYYWLVEVD